MGPPRQPRRRLTRDKCVWRRGRVGQFADRPRAQLITHHLPEDSVTPCCIWFITEMLSAPM